jgi:hypothetical protein
MAQMNGLLGRKLSANSLRNTKISPHLIEDAKNLLFSQDSMSFFPPIAETNFVRHTLTMAEMAVIPLHISLHHFHHHDKSHHQHGHMDQHHEEKHGKHVGSKTSVAHQSMLQSHGHSHPHVKQSTAARHHQTIKEVITDPLFIRI